MVLVGGLALLWAISSSSLVDSYLSRIIEWALKRYSSLEIQDYASLLHLAGDYRITEMQIQQADWLADKKLKEIRLWDEGLLVLGIERKDGTFLGTPKGKTILRAENNLVVYGHIEALQEIDARRRGRNGEHRHRKAVRSRQDRIRKEARIDPEGK